MTETIALIIFFGFLCFATGFLIGFMGGMQCYKTEEDQ